MEVDWPGECPECGCSKALAFPDDPPFCVCAECGLVYADDETLEYLKNSTIWMPSEFARRWGFTRESEEKKQFKGMVGFLDEMIPPSDKPRMTIQYILYHIHEEKMYVDSYLE